MCLARIGIFIQNVQRAIVHFQPNVLESLPEYTHHVDEVVRFAHGHDFCSNSFDDQLAGKRYVFLVHHQAAQRYIARLWWSGRPIAKRGDSVGSLLFPAREDFLASNSQPLRES